MVRNLLDQDFEPYAALVMALELEEVFQSLYHIGGLRAPSLTVDGVPVLLLEEDGEGAAAPSPSSSSRRTGTPSTVSDGARRPPM